MSYFRTTRSFQKYLLSSEEAGYFMENYDELMCIQSRLVILSSFTITYGSRAK